MSAATHQAPERNGTGPAPPALRITGLSKTFGATRALIAAALDIRPGEIHALVGQNGSGKSTLIKTLGRLPRARPRQRRPSSTASRSTLGHARARAACASSIRTSASCSSSTRWTTSRCTAASPRGAAGRVRWREQARETHRVLARFGVDSTSTARSPPRRPSSAPWSRSPRRCRAGRAAAACSSSTSRPRSCRTTRSSGCSRWCARSATRARACSTSRTASTRSSSWPTA